MNVVMMRKNNQRHEGAEHEDIAMSKVDHADNAIDHRVADGDQAIDRAEREPVDHLLEEIFHREATHFTVRGFLTHLYFVRLHFIPGYLHLTAV